MSTGKSGFGHSSSPYNGALTREQFLFIETRTTARLLTDGLDWEDVLKKIVEENLFQYPTERMLRNIAQVCIKRLRTLNDPNLVSAVAREPSDVAKQICLYAMMRQYRLVGDFMVTVIGRKYQELDLSFTRVELNRFFSRLQTQDEHVASWSESTVTKLKQVMTRILVMNSYLDSSRSDHLNPVLISPVLEASIRSHGATVFLPAFNCLT